MSMFKHPPRPLRRHTISKCCAIFLRNPFPLHQFHISCRPHRPTQHLVLQLPGQENCIFGRCHQLAQASKHHPRTSQKTRVVWTSGEKTTGLFPKEAAIMDTVFMFILEIKFSPKFTCSQTKWMPPRRFSSWARSSGHPLQVPKGRSVDQMVEKPRVFMISRTRSIPGDGSIFF